MPTPTGSGAEPVAPAIAGPDAAAQPGAPATSAAVAPPSGSVPVIDQFLLGRGESPGNLQVWYERQLGTPDYLYGFSYTGANGLPCAGFLLTAPVNGVWQPNNGALACAPQPGIPALASISLFATTDGQPYTIVFGRVEDPAVTAIAVVYADGSNQTVEPFLGGFLFAAPGLLEASVITAINQQGNTVIDNILQVPAS